MRGFSISLAVLLCGAVAVPLLAAGTPGRATKTLSAQKSTEEKKDRDFDERNHRRNQPAGVRRHGHEAGHDVSVTSEKEDGHDE